MTSFDEMMEGIKCVVCGAQATVEFASWADEERFAADPCPPELYPYCDEHAEVEEEDENRKKSQ